MTAVPGGTPVPKTGESGLGARAEVRQGTRRESGPSAGAGSRQGARPESEKGTRSRSGHGESPGARGWQGARLRAAVDRLHAAQLAALAPQGGTAAPALPAFAPPAPPEPAPASRRDAHAAQREALAQVDEMGSLLMLLGQPGRPDGEAAAVRRRLVRLAVAAANTLAELVGLAFEIESPAD
jgi:hypothetical protein